MRTVFLLMIASLLVALPCRAQSVEHRATSESSAPTVDFSGTWTLDTARSWVTAPDKVSLPAETLVVTQSPASLILRSSAPHIARSDSIALARRVRTRRAGTLYDVGSEWKNGQLIVTMGLSRSKAARHGLLVWSLDASGDELTVYGTSQSDDFSSPNGIGMSEVETRRVYRRLK